jgi:hypothetical protein
MNRARHRNIARFMQNLGKITEIGRQINFRLFPALQVLRDRAPAATSEKSRLENEALVG